jgi:hypothetical protein
MRDLDPGELLQQMIEPLQRQLGAVHDVVEREWRLQREVTGRLIAPFNARAPFGSRSAGVIGVPVAR